MVFSCGRCGCGRYGLWWPIGLWYRPKTVPKILNDTILITVSDLAKYSITRSITRSLCGIWVSCSLRWQFYDLQYRVSAISNFWNLEIVTWPLSPCCSASMCKISLKSDNHLIVRFQIFPIFKMAAVRHLEFQKLSDLIMQLPSSFYCAVVYQISPKSLRYGDLTIFMMGDFCHL